MVNTYLLQHMLMWISLSDQHPVSAPIAQWGIWISVMFHLSHWGTYLSSGTWPCSHILATKRWQHEKATTSAIITCQPLIIKLHVVVLESELFNAQIPIQTVHVSKRSNFPFRINQISTQVWECLLSFVSFFLLHVLWKSIC